MKKKILISAVLISVVLYLLLMRDFNPERDTIYYNGTILTMEDSRPVVSAVYVRDGIIAAADTTESVMKMKTGSTVLVDLDGRTMMPGFIDPHTHLDISAFLYGSVDLSGFTHRTNKEVWAHLEKAVKEFPEGAWIYCKGLDPILTSDLRNPHITYLDKVAPNNPLVISSQSLHSYWANSRAFREAGISAKTPDPSGSSFYEKDSKGNLTGFIAEQKAFSPIREALIKATPVKTLIRKVDATLRDYAAKGNTTVVSAGLTSDDRTILRLYGHLSSGEPQILGQLLALIGVFPERSPLPRHFIYMRHDMEKLLPSGPDNGDDFFKVIGIKIWYDGSPYTGSMYLKEPYLNSDLCRNELHIQPGYRGNPLFTKDELKELISRYNREKWQIAIHAQGDSANAEVMEIFEEVNKTSDITPYRHRIEHCLLLDKNLLPVMKGLNITPSFHVNHIYYYGRALRDSIIGSERANLVLPVKSAADRDMNFTLHADQPMFESNPFSLISTAITRKTGGGLTLGAQEGIALTEALKSMTINAAWQIGFEDKLGSIKSGKYADLIILDRNPFEVPAEELREIRVLKTIINGNTVSYGM